MTDDYQRGDNGDNNMIQGLPYNNIKRKYVTIIFQNKRKIHPHENRYKYSLIVLRRNAGITIDEYWIYEILDEKCSALNC